MSDFTTTPPNADYQLTVAVRPEYLPDQSEPAAEHYVFAYHVTITNTGRVAAQVVSRHWIITDGDGREEQVKGLAVVGYQPVLKPGEKFEYTSGTPLPTPSGFMVGTYQMETRDGNKFDVAVPAFSLDSPHQPVKLN